MTEGLNNKIKLMQRMASGLQHAHKRRKRIMAYSVRRPPGGGDPPAQAGLLA